MYNHNMIITKNTYLGLENIGGEAISGGAVLGGTTVIRSLHWSHTNCCVLLLCYYCVVL